MQQLHKPRSWLFHKKHFRHSPLLPDIPKGMTLSDSSSITATYDETKAGEWLKAQEDGFSTYSSSNYSQDEIIGLHDSLEARPGLLPPSPPAPLFSKSIEGCSPVRDFHSSSPTFPTSTQHFHLFLLYHKFLRGQD